MQMNEKLMITVSEPWDFSSSDGDNIFACTIIEINKNNKESIYLARTNSAFKINEVIVNYVVLQSRDKSNKNFNIYYINDNELDKFQDIYKCLDKLNFIIIGSLKTN